MPFNASGFTSWRHAPLVSTALMTITLAKVAGCKDIVVCTLRERWLDQSGDSFAARLRERRRFTASAGVQAVAALAYGTRTIRRVQKIFGPGNAYVSMAKRLLFGRVAVDLLAGPRFAGAGRRHRQSQVRRCRHAGPSRTRLGSRTCLAGDQSAKVLKAVEKEIAKQLPKLARREMIQRVLDRNVWLIQVKSVTDGVALTNQIAPEHCEVITKDARKVSASIVTAGALFLGNYSPTVLGIMSRVRATFCRRMARAHRLPA